MNGDFPKGRHCAVCPVNIPASTPSFDYYNARYYDPVCGTFLSADPVQGTMQGMNPYAYVGGNPETYTDPTGNMYAPPGGGGGGGNGGGGGTPPPSCQGWCWVQQQWNNFNNNVVHPVEHLVQQVPEEIIHHVPIIVPIVIGIFAVATIGGFAYAIWQLTHTNPNWSNVSAGENVTHPHWHWFDKEGKFRPGIGINKGHVIRKHVNIDNSSLRNRAKQIADNTGQDGVATKFDSAAIAQWTVNYALEHMTAAQKSQLLFMRGSPFGRFSTLTLTGDTGTNIGWGYRVSTTGHVTKLNNLSSYVVVVGIDFKTGQPFIVTAFPTP